MKHKVLGPSCPYAKNIPSKGETLLPDIISPDPWGGSNLVYPSPKIVKGYSIFSLKSYHESTGSCGVNIHTNQFSVALCRCAESSDDVVADALGAQTPGFKSGPDYSLSLLVLWFPSL